MTSNIIVVTIPVSFTASDVKNPDWPKIRKALVENAAKCVDEEIGKAARKCK